MGVESIISYGRALPSYSRVLDSDNRVVKPVTAGRWSIVNSYSTEDSSPMCLSADSPDITYITVNDNSKCTQE